VILPGPDPALLRTGSDGVYHVLLRIEVSSEKEGNSDLAAAGAGQGVLPAGAVAGFPMPTLRYIVGSGQVIESVPPARETLPLLTPTVGATLSRNRVPTFTWQSQPQAALYRIEIQAEGGSTLLSALVPGELASYQAPSWFAERAAGRAIQWRVIATDAAGREFSRSAWRSHAWN
jgi:hypothetical protein